MKFQIQWNLKRVGERDPDVVGGTTTVLDTRQMNFGRPDGADGIAQIDRQITAIHQSQTNGTGGYEKGLLFSSEAKQLGRGSYLVTVNLKWATNNSEPNKRVAQLRVVSATNNVISATDNSSLATIEITSSTLGQATGRKLPANSILRTRYGANSVQDFISSDSFQPLSLRFSNPTSQSLKLVLFCDGIGIVEVGSATFTFVPAPVPNPVPPQPEPVPVPRPDPAPKPTPVVPLVAPRVARTIVLSTRKTTFSFNDMLQPIVVPNGVTSLTVKLWGAGGGQNGGSGAFIEGKLPVTPGETLHLIIGEGGQIAKNGEKTRVASPAGGVGQGDSVWHGGGGGGLTAILRGTTPLVVVGAGGGGQYYGGGGGGTNEGKTGEGAGGYGGTQQRPRVAFSGPVSGTPGGTPYGGNGGQNSGGGGTGYHGGTGGGRGTDNGGGGGGSSLFSKLKQSSLVRRDGQNGRSGGTTAPILPGGATDLDYVTGVGIGGANGKPGGPGRIVILKS